MGKENLKGSIIKLRENGKSVNEIQKILNCSKSTISFHLNKNNMGGVLSKFKNEKDDNEFIKGIEDDIINKIVNYKKDGKTYKEIYTTLNNISYDKIKRVCSIFNLNKTNTLIKFDDPNFIELIKLEYQRLGSIKKVAKELSVSHKNIRKHITINRTKQTEEERKKSIVNHVNKNRKKKKQELVEYKGGCCQVCGYDKSLNVLQFHHINPNEKDFGVGGKNYSLERMKKEVDKCILLCANCHIEIHEEIDNFGFSKFVEEYKNRRLE